jgi:FeS assembly SUF system protein
MATVNCLRCGKEGEGFVQPPYPGKIGELVLKGICVRCYDEWKKFSVNVINDYKLRPFLPEDRAVLEKQMKQFLNLEGGGLKQIQGLPGQERESAKGEKEEKVIDLLKQIFDPEIPVNIYDLGLIYGIKCEGAGIAVKMTLTTPNCPAAQSLPATVKQALERIPGITQVSVEVVWTPPWTREMISEEGCKILGLSN